MTAAEGWSHPYVGEGAGTDAAALGVEVEEEEEGIAGRPPSRAVAATMAPRVAAIEWRRSIRHCRWMGGRG